MFKKATRRQQNLRLALCGPPGSGKSFSALRLGAALLKGGERMAVIDTEHGSAELYADEPNPDGGRFEFDCARLDLEHGKFSPANYLRAIRAAADAGYRVLVVDSLSHAWAGPGGVLDYVDDVARRSKSGNKFTAWREGTEEQNKLVDALLSYPGHLICTMRTKTEYVQEKDNRGRTQIRKVGLSPVQRDGVEYEFTVVGDIDVDQHRLTITKSRCSALADRNFVRPGREMADILTTWLDGGAPAEPAARPAAEEPRQEAQGGISWDNFAECLGQADLVLDEVIWFAATRNQVNLKRVDDRTRQQALDWHLSEDGRRQLAEAVGEVRDRFRTAFMSRWNAFMPIPTQKGGASAGDQQRAREASETERRRVMRDWYGVESVKEVPIRRAVGKEAERGIDWLKKAGQGEFEEAAMEVMGRGEAA